MAKKAEDKAPEEVKADLAAEFAELGRALRDALAAAWNSEERAAFSSEIRSGLQNVADELEEAARAIRNSEFGQDVETKARQTREDVQSGKIGDEMRDGIAKVLRSTRDAIDHMADSFTPTEGDKVEFEPLDMDRAKKKPSSGKSA